MKSSAASVPPYVDTATPLAKWYAFHLTVLIASAIMAALAALVLEYEIAKINNPQVSFLATPTRLDMILSSSIILLAIANLGVLIFVFRRHLWLRRWMAATTALGWVLLAVMALALNDAFLPVILPWYRMPL